MTGIFIFDLLLAAFYAAQFALLILFSRLFREDLAVHPIYRQPELKPPTIGTLEDLQQEQPKSSGRG